MRILFAGDVVSSAGCDFMRKVLPAFKKQQEIDFCIVNGENSAQGNGILPQSAESLFTSGADVITTGNHCFRRNEILSVLEKENSCVLRPCNMHRSAPGSGVCVLEKKGLRLAVVNMLGVAFMEPAANPFDCADELIEKFAADNIKNIFVDFHAEATAEKRTYGFYLDGRVSAVCGTHTHVQTADEQILPNGTAYITDTGMTGVINSVLGVSIANATQKLRTGLPTRFENPSGECAMCCVVIETDNLIGRAVSIERFRIE